LKIQTKYQTVIKEQVQSMQKDSLSNNNNW